MAMPDGYKIYWGTSADNLNGTHPDPAKSHYNSPITVPGGNISQHVLPSDFWDNSFTTLYFSLTAYSGDDEGVRSTPIELGTCQRTMSGGLQTFCIPLDDGNSYTPKQLVSILGASQILVKQGSLFKAYTAFSANPGPVLQPHMGVLVIFPSAKNIVWRGRAWSAV